MDLAFNNLQRLICHKTKPTKPSVKITEEMQYFSESQGSFLTKEKILKERGVFCYSLMKIY